MSAQSLAFVQRRLVAPTAARGVRRFARLVGRPVDAALVGKLDDIGVELEPRDIVVDDIGNDDVRVDIVGARRSGAASSAVQLGVRGV